MFKLHKIVKEGVKKTLKEQSEYTADYFLKRSTWKWMWRFPNVKVNDMGFAFWVVTTPTADSTVEDILFPADLFSFANQVRGGLDFKEVVGIHTDFNAALDHAQQLLNKR